MTCHAWPPVRAVEYKRVCMGKCITCLHGEARPKRRCCLMADAIGGYKKFSSRAFNLNCYTRYAMGYVCIVIVYKRPSALIVEASASQKTFSDATPWQCNRRESVSRPPHICIVEAVWESIVN